MTDAPRTTALTAAQRQARARQRKAEEFKQIREMLASINIRLDAILARLDVDAALNLQKKERTNAV